VAPPILGFKPEGGICRRGQQFVFITYLVVNFEINTRRPGQSFITSAAWKTVISSHVAGVNQLQEKVVDQGCQLTEMRQALADREAGLKPRATIEELGPSMGELSSQPATQSSNMMVRNLMYPSVQQLTILVITVLQSQALHSSLFVIQEVRI
jgi:hypothetical protein